MTLTGAHLAVDIGPVTSVAAISRGGQRTAIVFGDSLTVATPTVGDDPGVDVISALETRRGDDADTALAVLAEHLRTVTGYAGPCDALTIIVPPSWGPRPAARLSQAATEAGLPTPQVMSRAAAIAEHTCSDAPEGATVLVCVLGQHSSSTTVVQRQHQDWVRIATQPVPRATGDHLDHTLTDTAASATVIGQLTDARARLAGGQAAAIVVPGRPAPLLIQPADFEAAVLSARHAVLAAITDTLDAADVDVQQLYAAVAHGELADLVLPPEQVREHLGVTTAVEGEGRLSAVYGALRSGPVAGPAAGLDRRTLRAEWASRGARLIAPIAAMVVGAVLQWQIFDIVAFALGPQVRRLPADYAMLPVVFDTAAFATAGWCMIAGCLAVARHLVIALLADTGESGKQPRRQAGRIYAFAAVVGLALASLQGLLAEAIIGGPPTTAPPYLAAALAGAIVPAVIAICVGLAAPWLVGRPLWTDRLHHPVVAVVLATVGILACNARDNRLPIAGVPAALTAILGVAGAGLLGVGIAVTLVTQPAARLILGAVIGTASMVIVGLSNLHSAIVIYLIAVALWWVRRGGRIVLDNLPPRWWRRIGLVEDATP